MEYCWFTMLCFRCIAKWFTYVCMCVCFIYIYVYVYFFYILFHYTLLQDIEYQSLCYRVGPFWLSILYAVVYFNPKLLVYPSPTPKKNPKHKNLFQGLEKDRKQAAIREYSNRMRFMFIWLCLTGHSPVLELT